MRGWICWAIVWGLSSVAACGGGTIAGGTATGGTANGAASSGATARSGGTTSGGSSRGGDAAGGIETGGGEGCITGDERCACYPNGTCNDALACLSDLCVRLPGTGGVAGAGATLVGGGGTTSPPAGGGGSAGAAGEQPSAGGSAGEPGGRAAAGGAEGGTGGAVASCSSVDPCGGDAVGTWTVQDSCLNRSGDLNAAALGLGCTTATMTGTLRVSGSWTADADGTYSDDLTWVGEDEITLAPECLQVSGTTTTCDRLEGLLTGIGYLEGLPYTSMGCVEDPVGGGCTCTADVERVQNGEAGTYTAANGVVTTSGGLVFSYCIDGDTLTMTPQAWSTSTQTSATGTVLAVGPDDTGGSDSVTPLPADATLGSLSAAESEQLCDDAWTFFARTISTGALCKYLGLSFAATSSAPSDQQLVANCDEKESACLPDPAAAWDTNTGCSDIPAGCEATVAQYSTCIRDTAANFEETVGTLPSCNDFTVEGTGVVWDFKGADRQPSCVLVNCTTLWPPDPRYL